jgi:putative transposase
MRKAASRQLQLKIPARGGKRRGAGRKPNLAAAGMSHLKRPALASRYPVHVTLRVREGVWNLRSRRSFRRIAAAFRALRHRSDFRLSEYAILGNHLHLIVEATNERCLARGLQSLEIRVAKALNKMMKTSGRVFADRYHAHILRTPTEVANALRYVRGNFAVHAARRGETAPGAADEYSSAALVDGRIPNEQDGPLVTPPKTWLLGTGWRLGRGNKPSLPT